MTVSGIRCRAYPDLTLQELLPRWIGSQRVIYNAKVNEDRYYKSVYRKALSLTGEPTPLDQQYSRYKDKELTPWLYEVPSPILRNGAYRWMTAKTRQLKGLAKAPRIRKRHDFDSVLITSELFRFVECTDKHTGELKHEIEIGTETKPLGRIRFTARAPYELPAMLVVRRTGSGKWFVSFSFEKVAQTILRTKEEIAYEINLLSDDELSQATIALDRNVKDNCLADSNGAFYNFKEVEKHRMNRKAVHRKRYQRRLARQDFGSRNREETKRKIAATYEYASNVRNNFAHQLSHALTSGPSLLFIFEALQTKNMVRKPKPKQGENGRWLRNGAKAKAGLNSAILGSAWGKAKQYTEYKAAEQNKLVITVPAAYTSQECCQCGHTHPDNRSNQRFVCQRCGFVAHADTNAATVQKQRGIALLRNNTAVLSKPKKRTAFRRTESNRGRQPRSACGTCIRPEELITPLAVSVEAGNLRLGLATRAQA